MQMRRFLCLFFLTGWFLGPAFGQNDYFFPEGVTFDENIPSPQEFLGYPIGDFHTRHDRVVAYFRRLAEVTDRAAFQIIGYTNEHRPQIVLTLSSEDNHANLEAIRQRHLRLADPAAELPAIEEMPAILLLGYNVHGNEPSSAEAAMLTAYYLLAAENEEARNFLDKAVIMIDPVFNPDGRDRHTNWVNMHHGFPPVADPNDREHNEVWPSGRTNHYWFDLNRDWLPLAQVESRNRVEFYHRWLPNVTTDYHEMGANSTYFFEPTEPFGSENPVVPRANYEELNQLFADYFEEALNDIGSFYFTKEIFDNSYPGYGSTYPDIHGGLGLVFEQASSRGHLQKTSTGEIAFAFTIRNHLRTSIATVRAAVENRRRMHQWLREFFDGALEEARESPVEAYVYTHPDAGRRKAFTELLLRHQIQTYQLEEDTEINGQKFRAGTAYAVPTEQKQYRMVKTMFEPVTEFYDSVFYDASAWAVALAFNLTYEGGARKVSMGDELQLADLETEAPAVTQASYAYLLDWSDYRAARALAFLLQRGVNVKTAFKPFTASVGGQARTYGYGSLVVPVVDQPVDPEALYALIREAAADAGLPFQAVRTGRSIEGIDLGSRNFRTVEHPRPLMLVGEGASGYETGEIWHLMDTRLNMPITKVDMLDFGRVDLNDYRTLVMASGSYRLLDERAVGRIKAWANAGGALLLQRGAVAWAIRNELVDEALVAVEDTIEGRRDFVRAREIQGAQRIGGSVYRADLDITHPLGFGYPDRSLNVYRNHEIFVRPSDNPYSTVAAYTDDPLLDGYIHPDKLEQLPGMPSLLVSRMGRGRAILFIDNPNFRGFWYGTNRLFFNGLFFGGLVYVP